ncbi:MAG: hypothetical protein GXO90_05245 [FCB group bacterium]|nr:hypothetical protein [FCB group bacterium]
MTTGKRLGFFVGIILLFQFSCVTRLVAQENSDCFSCHEDESMTATVNGREVSAFVNEEAFDASVHGDLDCITCHSDLSETDFPHDEDLEYVQCTDCHDDVGEELSGGPHSRLYQDADHKSSACITCHGLHGIQAPVETDSPVNPQNVDQLCVRCHATENNIYQSSIHAAESDNRPNAACTDCHQGHGMIQPTAENIEIAVCGQCHPKEVNHQEKSVHARAALRGDPLAPSCITCHGHHDILPASDQNSITTKLNVPVLCGRCHHEGTKVSLERNIPQKNILENYSLSIHGQGLYKMGLRVTAVCTSCHQSHLILSVNNPESSINPKNVAKTCTVCHSRIEEVHTKVINGQLWEEAPHKIPSCVDCHQPHKIRQTPLDLQSVSNSVCLQCHGDEDLTVQKAGKTISLYVDEKKYTANAHGTVACAQCHNEVSTVIKRPCATITNKVDCSICHADITGLYQTGIHGQRAAEGDQNAPTCLTCHNPHITTRHQDQESSTYAMNVPKLCGQCHAAGKTVAEVVEKQIPTAKDIVNRYTDSVHGQGLLKSGLVVAANCASCHTPHHELPKSDPNSSVNPRNLANTCGTCHKGIEDEFRKSIHWPGNIKTDKKLPICEDCHTSHTISRTGVRGFRMQMMKECGTCHEEESATYFTTVHGQASRLGENRVAKCYDCHGTHNILPPEYPNSTLAYQNVVQTCKKCHPSAQRKFAGYLTHATHHNKHKYPYLYYTYIFMTSLLVGTLTFFMIHTLLWLRRLWRDRKTWQPIKTRVHKRFYVRFSLTQRIMHLTMLLSFFTLAITGMALKFSYAGWAVIISKVLGGFSTTGILHRIAALTLMGLFLFHLWQIVEMKIRSGKTWLRFIFDKDSMMFTLTDIRQLWQHFLWFINKGEKPRYSRFSYWEKFDYFAVFWGVLVIGSTGLILWFPTFFTHLLPGWMLNVAMIIHSDEALLATAFIFTIHFFNTHFRPDKFPMDPVIFTGRVPLEELKHDKPAEYEQLQSMENPEDRIAGPMSRRRLRWIRVFGLGALTIGLTLVILILYAMIFVYK